MEDQARDREVRKAYLKRIREVSLLAMSRSRISRVVDLKREREPLADEQENLSTEPDSNPLLPPCRPAKTILKAEPLSETDPETEKQEDFSCDEPAKKKFRRIRKSADSDSNEENDKMGQNTNKSANEESNNIINDDDANSNSRATTKPIPIRPKRPSSSDDDVYIPLVAIDDDSRSESQTGNCTESSQSSSEEKRKVKVTPGKTSQRHKNEKQKTRSTSKTKNQRKSHSNGCRRSRSRRETDEDSSDSFIVSASEDLSEDDDDFSGCTSSASSKEEEELTSGRQTRSKTKNVKAKNIKTKTVRFEASSNEANNKEDSNSSSESLFQAILVRVPASRKDKIRRSRKSRNKTSKKLEQSKHSSSDSELSESNSKRSPKKPLSQAVKTKLKGFLESSGIRNTKKKRSRRNSGAKDPEVFDVASGSDDDHFIDDETNNYGNLGSSSPSDSVVSEEDDILDLDPDHFKEGGSSSDEKDPGPKRVPKKSKREDKSSSSSESSGSTSSVRSCDANGNLNTHKPTPVEPSRNFVTIKCALCENLSDTDFKNRDREETARNWCDCSRCVVVSARMRNYDRVCCKEIKAVREFMKEELEKPRNRCITQHPRFEKDVLEYEGFIRSCKNRIHGKLDRSTEREMEKFKRATEKEKVNLCKYSFIRWIFNKIGWDNRMVVPACVVGKIRKRWSPSAGPLYYDGFVCTKTCDYKNHCVKAMHKI